MALERSYRRLLLAYPKRYRRYRETEMLTTLMDVAPAGRTRPSFMDILSILMGGLRCRLAPGGPITVAVVTALLVAVAGGAAGAFIGWQGAASLPSDDDATAIAHSADARMPAAGPTDRRDFLFGYGIPVQANEEILVALLGGDEYTAGYLQYTVTHPDDSLATLRDANGALAKDGWDAEPVSVQSYGGEFWATRGDLMAHMVTQGGSEGNETSLWIQRARPAPVPLLTLVGFALGALAGWQLAGWAARRRKGQPLWQQAAVTSAFVLGAIALLPPTLFNLVAIASSLWTVEPTPAWIGYVFIMFRGLALLGTALLLAALALTALPAGEPRANRREA
jgi:hypothetical protein